MKLKKLLVVVIVELIVLVMWWIAMLLNGQQSTACIQNGKRCEAGHRESRIPADPWLKKEILGQSGKKKKMNININYIPAGRRISGDHFKTLKKKKNYSFISQRNIDSFYIF